MTTTQSIEIQEENQRIMSLIHPLAEAIAKEIGLQKKRLFLWLPVFFSLGIGLYFSLPVEPPKLLGGIVFILCAASYAAFRPLRERNEKTQILYLLLFALTFATAGFTASQIRTVLVHTPAIEKRMGPVEIIGTVETLEYMGEKEGSRMVLNHLTIENLRPEETPRRIRLRLRKDEASAVGQKIKILALLNPPSSPVMPGAFDFRRYLYFQGIGAVGFVFNAPEILPESQGQKSLTKKIADASNIEYLRHIIDKKIRDTLPPRQASIVAAFLIEERQSITDEDDEAMRDSGLAHILSISGLHVSLAAGLVFFFVRLCMAAIPTLALQFPIKKIAAVIAFAAGAFYVALAGGDIPAQRSLLMTGIVFLAIILDRSPFSLRLIAFAALIVLIFAPESLLSASFQLSFAAVAALIAFYESTQKFWGNLNRNSGFLRKVILYFVGVSITTLIAGFATAPLALYHFQKFAVLGIVANFIAVPLMAFIIMPFGVLAFLLMPLGLEKFALLCMGAGSEQILNVAHWAAGLPGAVYAMQAWPFSAMLILIFAGLITILWKGWGKLIALPLVISAVFLILTFPSPDILVSGSHKLMGFRMDDGNLHVSSRRADKFVLKNWERLLGLEEGSAIAIPDEGTLPTGATDLCDREACRLLIKNKKVAYVKTPYALKTECPWADILIATDPVSENTCRTSVIIDKFSTYDNGAYAIWITDKKIQVKSVHDITGNRPWTHNYSLSLQGEGRGKGQKEHQ